MDQFFTWGSFASLGGATAATVIVNNTVVQVTGLFRRWMPFIIAQIVCLGAAFQQGLVGSDYLLAALNGCLVYLSAAGMNNGVLAVRQDGDPHLSGRVTPRSQKQIGSPDRPTAGFFRDWFLKG